MRQIFLYGGYADTFTATTAPFVAAAGGSKARITLLFPVAQKVERYLGLYREAWLGMGAAEVIPIAPQPGTVFLDDVAMGALQTCSGIFMCGGNTRQYRDVYVRSQVRLIIRERYAAGVPYGGVSAGALLAPDRCSVWGDRLTAGENTLCLRGSEDGCDEELETGEGLGLLPGCMTEAHFSEQSGFTRLAVAMAREGVAAGLGMDDPICVHIQDEAHLRVTGRGLAFWVLRQPDGRMEVRMLQPGYSFSR